MFFVKAYICYTLTAVTVILVNREFSLLNVFFQSNFREIVESIKVQSDDLNLQM